MSENSPVDHLRRRAARISNRPIDLQSGLPVGYAGPLVCGPRRAQELLDIGNTHFYSIIGELDIIRDGRYTKVGIASIYRRLTALAVASARG
jgi:hypothetical protein